MLKAKESLRVLVVHNEHLVADSLAMILTAYGCEAMAVYSGSAAVDAASILKPDLLISDVVMDDMNGIDAAILIRRSTPGCRVILLSEHMSEVNLLHRVEAEGNCFEMLEKPVHPQVLLDHVAALCETSWLGTDTPLSETGHEASGAKTEVEFDAKTDGAPRDKSSTSMRAHSSAAAVSKWCN